MGCRESSLENLVINFIFLSNATSSSDVRSILSGKKVLITGHTGFKGSWLSLWLKQKGAILYGISKDIPTQPSLFGALELEKEMEHILMDIRDLSSIKSEVKRISPDFISHDSPPIVSLSYLHPI
ncbi:GDP-mannose 4,6-dehydratase [Algoriphagus sp. D3-2-R+10]|uniref:GDP-mannose 4,6-dehydratase n=1 Tax=Algoriphagus aurantiacus TaxID=3103948 RepID=UPI003A5CE58D